MLKTLGIVKGALLTEKQRRHLARRLDGKSVLEWVVRQMTDCELLSGVVVLANEGEEGDLVRDLSPIDVPVFSSPAKDTLTFLQQALRKFPSESCVFIGSDWPFLDPTIIDQLVRTAEMENNCDYSAYQFMNEIFSAGRPYGLFPEWYRGETLHQIKGISDPLHLQLPGTFFLDNQDKFIVELLPAPLGCDCDGIRFSVEDEDDWDNLLDLHDALDLDVLNSRKLLNMLRGRSFRREFVS